MASLAVGHWGSLGHVAALPLPTTYFFRFTSELYKVGQRLCADASQNICVHCRPLFRVILCATSNFHVVLCRPPNTRAWPRHCYVCFSLFLVHGQVTIIFVVSVGLFVCLFVQSFSQPSLIRFRSNLDICYTSGSSCVS